MREFIKPITTFKDTRSSHVPEVRLAAVRKAAHKFRDELQSSGSVPFFRAVTLVNVPYPTRYAFFGVYNDATFVTPIIHITNRLFVIRFQTEGGLKTLLFSPSDIMANAETRFFKRFGGGFLTKLQGDSIKPFKDAAQQLVAPIAHTVEEWLPLMGFEPSDIDYISYDHLHTQDLRNWLGTADRKAYFPNAKLLVMRQEWESATGLLPPQKDWYCPNGIAGIDPQKIILLDDDVMLGPGLALVRTPGHTWVRVWRWYAHPAIRWATIRSSSTRLRVFMSHQRTAFPLTATRPYIRRTMRSAIMHKRRVWKSYSMATRKNQVWSSISRW